MNYTPENENGQALSADSAPVVLSTEQETILQDTLNTLVVIESDLGNKSLETGGNLESINAYVAQLPITQNSSTSGEKGVLGMGAVTTSAPSYSDSKTQPLSLKTTGQLRTIDDDANTRLASVVTGLNTVATYMKNGTTSGVISALNSSPSGTATANSAVEFSCSGYSTALVQIKNTGSYSGGSLSLWGTVNGSDWIQLGVSSFYNINSEGASQSASGTTSAIYKVFCSGYLLIRVSCTASYTSGSTTVYISGSVASTDVTLKQSVAISSVQGSSSAFLLKNEDVASATGDAGVFTLGVRRDALTVSASATGDYNEESVTKYGSRYTKDEERQKITYSVTCEFAPATTPTHLIEIKGSASKEIRIQKIVIGGTQTTTGVYVFDILRNSTVLTGGTSTAPTIVKHEQADASATATVSMYTANPSGGGALVGVLTSVPVVIPATNAVSYTPYELSFGQKEKPLVIAANTTESISIHGRSTTLTGGRLYITITFTEE